MTSPGICAHCGTMLYNEWWDEATGGYGCHRCGAFKRGEAPTRGSNRIVIGLWLAAAGLLAADLAVVLAMLALDPEGPWRMAAIVALAAVLLTGVMFGIGTIAIARRRRA